MRHKSGGAAVAEREAPEGDAAPPDAKDRQRKGRKTVLPMSRLKIAEPTDDGKRRIEGYAAVFGNRDSYGDVIMPGAFEKTLRERPDVKVLYQHDTHQPIGKQVDAFEDEFGLRVQGELSNIDLVTNTVLPLLEDGVLTGLSIGYDVIEEEYQSDLNCWFLREIELWEWSPVTFPANELAAITGVKTLEGRKSAHLERVTRHAKSLEHELTGYFEKSDRRDGLDFDLLAKLHGLIGGALPGPSPLVKTADVPEELAEVLRLEGANAALAALQDAQSN